MKLLSMLVLMILFVSQKIWCGDTKEDLISLSPLSTEELLKLDILSLCDRLIVHEKSISPKRMAVIIEVACCCRNLPSEINSMIIQLIVLVETDEAFKTQLELKSTENLSRSLKDIGERLPNLNTSFIPYEEIGALLKHYLAKNGESIITFLDIDQCTVLHHLALWYESKQSRIMKAATIIFSMPDLNLNDLVTMQDSQGNTVLHHATVFGQNDLVKKLLRLPNAQKLVRVQDKWKCTVLHDAAARGQVSIVETLLSAENIGCNDFLNMEDFKGKTAFDYAKAHPDVLNLLNSFRARWQSFRNPQNMPDNARSLPTKNLEEMSL